LPANNSSIKNSKNYSYKGRFLLKKCAGVTRKKKRTNRFRISGIPFPLGPGEQHKYLHITDREQAGVKVHG
jgi:hypothetical protein